MSSTYTDRIVWLFDGSIKHSQLRPFPHSLSATDLPKRWPYKLLSRGTPGSLNLSVCVSAHFSGYAWRPIKTIVKVHEGPGRTQSQCPFLQSHLQTCTGKREFGNDSTCFLPSRHRRRLRDPCMVGHKPRSDERWPTRRSSHNHGQGRVLKRPGPSSQQNTRELQRRTAPNTPKPFAARVKGEQALLPRPPISFNDCNAASSHKACHETAQV